MAKKWIAIICLLVALGGVVAVEQIYTDNSLNFMLSQIDTLQISLENENLTESTQIANNLVEKWKNDEQIICLFVDFRDIEQIGKQTDLVVSHLNNQDFELARVECNTLKRVVETFKNMVGIDILNIL